MPSCCPIHLLLITIPFCDDTIPTQLHGMRADIFSWSTQTSVRCKKKIWEAVVLAADTLRGAGTRPIARFYVATGKEGQKEATPVNFSLDS